MNQLDKAEIKQIAQDLFMRTSHEKMFDLVIDAVEHWFKTKNKVVVDYWVLKAFREEIEYLNKKAAEGEREASPSPRGQQSD